MKTRLSLLCRACLLTVCMFLSHVASVNLQQADAGLLTNPGAETGDTSGWTITDPQFDAVTDRAGILLPHTGDYFFDGGGDNTSSQMHQDVDVSALVSFIDNGAASATLDLWMADDGGTTDYATTTLQFYDASFGLLDSTSVTTHNQSGGWLKWKEFTISDYAFPVGTRTLRVVLDGYHYGGHTDAYFDDISLTIGVPEPSTTALLGLGGLGLLVFPARRRRSKDGVPRGATRRGNGMRTRYHRAAPPKR